MIVNCSYNLINSPKYDFFVKQKQVIIDQLEGIGHASAFANALTNYDEPESGFMWAEIEGVTVGGVCFNKKDLDKKIMIINYILADTPEIQKALYNSFENFSKELGCVYINEAVSLKDLSRITQAESNGLSQDYYFLFKRVV